MCMYEEGLLPLYLVRMDGLSLHRSLLLISLGFLALCRLCAEFWLSLIIAPFRLCQTHHNSTAEWNSARDPGISHCMFNVGGWWKPPKTMKLFYSTVKLSLIVQKMMCMMLKKLNKILMRTMMIITSLAKINLKKRMGYWSFDWFVCHMKAQVWQEEKLEIAICFSSFHNTDFPRAA